MALDPSNSSNLEQLVLNGSTIKAVNQVLPQKYSAMHQLVATTAVC